MAKIEGSAYTVIVLTEDEVQSMLNYVEGKEDFWIRIVVEVYDSSSPASNTLIAYLQGPDGEEEKVFEVTE